MSKKRPPKPDTRQPVKLVFQSNHIPAIYPPQGLPLSQEVYAAICRSAYEKAVAELWDTEKLVEILKDAMLTEMRVQMNANANEFLRTVMGSRVEPVTADPKLQGPDARKV